jgi:alkanesulfonate monooxygenase SsuD/methylene tetrahydromethanopterin reductase-like flavin-dependent oxidoreductase (luciferase family)
VETVIRFDMRGPKFGAPKAGALQHGAGHGAVRRRAGRRRDRAVRAPRRGGRLPAGPEVLAGGFAARTSRARIRVGAVVLPLHHPVGVAERALVLDQVSNGRAEIVAAAGYVPSECGDEQPAHRRPVRLTDPDRTAREPAATDPGGELHPGRRPGRRPIGHRRRTPGDHGQRLLRRAHGIRRRRPRLAAGAGGGLRPGDRGDPLHRRTAGDRDRQQLRVRTGRDRLRRRREARAVGRPPGRDQHDRREPLQRGCERPVRRREGQRLGRECGPEGLTPYLQTKSVFA